MCHMCANQFYDSESSIEWYCLKKFNFELIHIRHINFFEFWKKKKKLKFSFKFCWIYNGILIEKWNFFKIQNWAYITCATCAQINFMTLKALLSDIVPKIQFWVDTHQAHQFFWILKNLIFRSISHCKSSGIWGKISFFFFFSKFKKIYIPDFYLFKI